MKDKIITVNGDKIDMVWDQIKEFLIAIPQDTYLLNPISIPFTRDKLVKKLCMAHIYIEDKKPKGLMITHYELVHNGKISLFVDFFSGHDFLSWQKEGFDYLEDFAKKGNCCAIEYVGRPGFLKLNPTFREDGRLYVKMLEEKNEVSCR